MVELNMKFDVKEVKCDLMRGINECCQRGLMHTTKWLAELNISLKNVRLDLNDFTSTVDTFTSNEHDIYTLAKSYFDLREYDRAAFFLQKCSTPRSRFLYLYCLYLSGENKNIDSMIDISHDTLKNHGLRFLWSELRKEHLIDNLDGFGLYLYGVVLKKMHLSKDALDVLVESTHKQPIHWGTWLELASLISDIQTLEALILPNHWLKQFFMAHMYLELQFIDEALALYYSFQNFGFQKNGYVLAQTAIAVNYKRGNWKVFQSNI